MLTGEYNKAVKEPTEQSNPIQQVFIHSNYNPADLTNDIGTIRYIPVPSVVENILSKITELYVAVKVLGYICL